MGRPPQQLVDAVAAAALALLALVEVVGNDELADRRAVTLAGALVVVGLVAVRRHRPVHAPVSVGAALVLQAALGGRAHSASFAVIAGLLLIAYTAASLNALRAAQAAGAALLAGLLLAIALDGGLSDALLAVVVLTAPWLAGRAAHRLHVLTEELARERDRSARDAVLAERSRIARDLHDVVAHAVSLMVVQAGGARGVLARPGQEQLAVEALVAVEETGRSALVEMRRLLDVLRTSDDDASELPGLDHVGRLVGGDGRLEVRGRPRPVPEGLDVAAYRVVQEALTNARRHAPGATPTVLLDWAERELVVRVDNPAAPDAVLAEGHGVRGMRERVGMYGGRLTVGPDRGCWRVEAVLPLEDPVAAGPA